MMNFMEDHHLVNCSLVPLADRFAGANVLTDILNMENWGEVVFLAIRGGGAVGTSKVYVNSCSDNAGTGRSAIGYWYRENYATDVWTAWQHVDAGSEFTMTAGANSMFEIRVLSSELDALDKWVECKFEEVDAAAVIGTVVAILTRPRIAKQIPDTVLA